MSHAARSDRPIRRWISTVRPLCLPFAASRSTRSGDEPGSIEYSAVTQPLPLPFIQRGTSSSTLAVHEHACAAERDEHAAGGHLGVVALERDRAQLVGVAAVGSGHGFSSGRGSARRSPSTRLASARRRSSGPEQAAAEVGEPVDVAARQEPVLARRAPRWSTRSRPSSRELIAGGERGLVGAADTSVTAGPITSPMTRARYG